MTKKTRQRLLNSRHEERYRAELSGLYHRKRERFFALLDRGSKAIALIAGSAAFSSVLQFNTAEWKSYAGLAVAIVTLLGLVFAWSDKARLHSDLAQKYFMLQSEIVGTDEDKLDDDLVCEWAAKIRQIEAAEPPTLTALVRLCQNQIAEAVGQKHRVYPLAWYQRWFAHIFDMPGKVEQPKGEAAN